MRLEEAKGWLARAWAWLLAVVTMIVDDHARDLGYAIAAAAWGLMRLAGKTVDSGSVGVKFSFGRVARLCEPGFYPLVPLFQTIRLVPSRARTLDLPRQTLSTVDGLVYTVDSNVVYRVEDARKALVEVDDYVAALGQMLSLSVHEALSARDRASLRVSDELDLELARAMQARCTDWGIRIERAGFTSIRPLRQTMRITQLAGLARSRTAALAHFEEAGLPSGLACGLIGTPARLVSRTRALRAVERRAREARALRELSSRLDLWLAARDEPLVSSERAARLRNARELLLARA